MIWEFSLNLLRSSCFSWGAYTLDKGLLCIPYYSISNSTLAGHFPGAKGIRQGQALSPYLFVLFMDYLSHMLDLASAYSLLDFTRPLEDYSLLIICVLYMACLSSLVCLLSIASGWHITLPLYPFKSVFESRKIWFVLRGIWGGFYDCFLWLFKRFLSMRPHL